MRIIYLIGVMAFFSSYSLQASKKACQPYLEKVRNIQSQQRVGHSNRKGRSLAEREQKARDKWWQCQQGKLPKPKTKTKKSKTKTKIKPNKSQYHGLKFNSSSTMTFSKPLTIKAKFQGQQQQDWLDYYQQPEKCKKAKSTKVFAYCIENEHQQQQQFIGQYKK
ncbi:hypothetical protein AADZ91_06120 [Colwelliaceae bacterium 6441]